ncbi:MAG TPA: DUF87 domain-containing protein [Anaerolineae bacterium]|nr:DUF87 domain-containing protein [Anaerolineae bacterium]
MSTNNLSNLFDKAEQVGVIGSPSSTTELALDILAGAVSKKLVGELALFRYLQDSHENYALGQITEIMLRNVWHEDPTMRSLIRQKGKVDAISERQDTHQGEMVVSAVFSNNNGQYRPSTLGTVPATGTPIVLGEDSILNELLSPYKEQLFYLGHVYGSKPKLPLWFKHFGKGAHGAGEAYHLGIFGKTGSGKSVLAKMILLGYAKHNNLGIFMFDPQGEFSMDLKNTDPKLSMGEILSPHILKTLNRKYEIYDLSRFRLGTWELFGELLTEFGFFQELGIKWSEYQENAADYILDLLRNNSRYRLSSLDDDAFGAVLDHLNDNIHRIYSGKGTVEKIRDIIADTRQKVDEGTFTPVKRKWDQTISFFLAKNNKVSIKHIIGKVLSENKTRRPMIVVDLSRKPADISSAVWDKKI